MDVEAAPKDYRLSWHELEVLKLLTDGLSDEEIAFRLEISSLQVRRCLTALQTKMGTCSRTETAVRAMREGLVDT